VDRNAEKILQEFVAVFGGNTFRMELNSKNRIFGVFRPLDDSIVAFRRYPETSGQTVTIDH
jgi:hypothetical protein